MKFAVLGATGGTGMQFVKQALAAGHEVEALVRNPEKMKEAASKWSSVATERLKISQMNVFDTERLAENLSGVDVVVSALGFSQFSKPVTGYLKVAKALVPAMNFAGCTRLIAVHSWRSSPDGNNPSKPFLVRHFVAPMMRAVFKSAFDNMDAAERYLSQDEECKDIEYTFVLSPRLTGGPVTEGVMSVAEGAHEVPDRPWPWKISRADLARFMLAAAVAGSHKRKVVAIAT